MGLVPVASAELPDHDEEIFVWNAEDADDDVGWDPVADGSDLQTIFTEIACSQMGGGSPSESPCEALGYDIGHTDTHMFFRWTMATLEFDSSAAADFTLMFDSGFRGNHPGEDYKRSFEFLLGVNAEDAWVEQARAQVGQDEWEDWTEDVIPGIDRAAGTLTVAVPLALIETRVDPERGALVGESINVTREPLVEVINEDCPENGGGLPACPTFMQGFESDKINGAASPENAQYRIHPIGELRPRVVEETISGDAPIIELSLDRPSWETHHYVWDASLFSGFTIDHALELDNGTVNLFMLDPDGESLWDSQDASGTGGGAVEDLEPGQAWTLAIEMTDWAEGDITVQLEGIEYVPEGSGNGNGGGSDENGDNGDGEDGGNATDGGADVDSQDSPAPAAALLLVALVGLFALYRRR